MEEEIVEQNTGEDSEDNEARFSSVYNIGVIVLLLVKE